MTQGTITLTDLVARQDLDAIDRWLDEHGALDVADELARLEPSDRAVVFRLLAKDRALAVFEALTRSISSSCWMRWPMNR